MSYRVRGFSYNTYITYNTYNNTTKKECPERHSLIFDLQRGFFAPPKICMAEEISRLAKCEKPQHT